MSEITGIATKHGLEADRLQKFIDPIIRRLIFDAEQLTDLFAPLGLGWKIRTQKELALMSDLIPFLHALTQGSEIWGLEVYE